MVHYEVNKTANRIEIYFDSKPSVSIRDFMKSNGWRWNPYGKYWVHYNSSHNVSVAKEICEMANTNKSISAPKKVTQTPFQSQTVKQSISIPKSVAKKAFNEKDNVIFELEGEKRFGEIIAVFDDSALVFYTKNRVSGEYDSINLPFDDIEKSSFSRHSTTPSRNTVVIFETNEGLIKRGIVKNDGHFSVNIIYFDISSTGKITMFTETNVLANHILDVSYFSSSIEDVLPLKVGDKVEYIDDEGNTKSGKFAEYMYGYEKVRIEYVEIDEWKDKYTWNDYVNINDVTKLSNLKKKLQRADYIDADADNDIAFNEEIKKRIQTKTDPFTESTHAPSKKPLFKHQLAGCVLAEKYNKFAFFYDTGTGKTVMALNIIESRYKKEHIRFLIIAPKSIIKTAWLDDASNFYPTMRILPLYKGFDAYKRRSLYRAWRTGRSRSTIENDKVFLAHIKLLADVFGIQDPSDYNTAQIDELLSSEAQHYIINPELFIANPHKYINDYGITGLVMDESAILKNYDSKTSKVMREVCEKLKYVYLLSGKPAPNNEIEFFSQMKIVAPEMFKFSHDRFLASFCISQSRRFVLNPANKDLFAEMVSTKSLIISKKDCLDLPDTIEMVRLIELPEAIMNDYNELYYECMVLIKGMDESSLFYSSQSKMAILMKLRQMASGFFMQKTDDGTESRIIIDIHKAKLNEVYAIIDEIPDEQIIIWCQFQHEIELLEKELSQYGTTVTAYGKTKHLEENIDDFKNGRAKYIIAHPKTLKYGVTFTNCKYAIYYSFSYSAEDYDQSHDRNYRLGQTESCTYFFLQAADTIDEIMYDKVMHKLSNAEFFEQLVKDAAKHGIDYASLKTVSDEEIREELTQRDGFSSIQDQIVMRSEQRERKRLHEESKSAFSTDDEKLDFFDIVPEPTEDELFELECELAKEKNNLSISYYLRKDGCSDIHNDRFAPDWLTMYSDFKSDHFASEKMITSFLRYCSDIDDVNDIPLDFSNCRLYEELFADSEENTPISFVDEPEELQNLMNDHPTKELWIAEMYRRVYHALDDLPEHISEMLRLKYGLNDGIRRNNVTIGDIVWSYYDEEEDKEYRCTAPRVSAGISQGLEMLAANFSLQAFREQVLDVFGTNL